MALPLTFASMNNTQSADKAGAPKDSNTPSASSNPHSTVTNTTKNNQNAAFLHPAFSFGHPGNPLDPSMLLTPTAAAAVAAVAQQIAQAGAPLPMALSTQGGQNMQHLGLSNMQSDPNHTLARQPEVKNDSNRSNMTLTQHQPVPPHLAILNASFSFGNNWPGMNVHNKGQSMTPAPAPMAFNAAASIPQNTPSMMQANFQAMQNNAANMVAAAAHVAAAQAAISSAPMADAVLSTMKGWKLEQIEEHVKLLQKLNQPVPQSVTVLLADSRRKEEKRSAKRVANRKSACTSRARKKALVEEMTKTNAKLRRQALILSLLPDLVIAMSIEGVITFCSAQVERVLQYKTDDLVGANLSDLIMPSSRDALRKLVNHLVAVEEAAAQGVVSGRGKKRRHGDQDTVENENGNQSSGSGSGADTSSGAIAVVSDKSFPLAVVQVESQPQPQPNNSDRSANDVTSGKPSSKSADSNALTRSLTSSSVGDSHSGEDDGRKRAARPQPSDQSKSEASGQGDSIAQKGSNRTSSDDSYSSSSAAKRLRQANANLERNVRWHKEKLQHKSGSVKSKSRYHMDDVTGASVTANNASARLSSLQHHPESMALSSQSSDSNLAGKKPSRYESMEEQSSSEDSLLAGVEEKKKEANKNESSDDSGYRESNGSLPSREESSSSDNEFPNEGGRRKRRKPLAPTCTVCLIRNDLTTLWCEVTSSIRTRLVEDESAEVTPQPTNSGKSSSSKSERESSGVKESEMESTEEAVPTKEVKELLLCLRPIRDGEKKVDESLRFTPVTDRLVDPGYETATLSANEDPVPVEPSAVSKQHRPPKKRFPQYGSLNSESSGAQLSQPESPPRPACASDAEKSVVESLILMSSEKN